MQGYEWVWKETNYGNKATCQLYCGHKEAIILFSMYEHPLYWCFCR